MNKVYKGEVTSVAARSIGSDLSRRLAFTNFVISRSDASVTARLALFRDFERHKRAW